MKLETKLISSLGKIFPDEVIGDNLNSAILLQNETFSFQVAFKNNNTVREVKPLYVRVETDLDINIISEYLEGYVPVTRADFVDSDDYFERKTAGLYPDMLFARKTNAEIIDDGQWWMPRWTEQNQRYLLESVKESYKGLWFTINENSQEIKGGKYYIKILFYDASNQECIAEERLDLEVINAKLPEQSLTYTSWFHCDCLADTYNVEIFSDEFFEIMRSYVKLAAKNGMDMIMLPSFTPPLDTTPGRERKTAQLVKVEQTGDTYFFDFSLMKKYIELCRECGIKKFEHNHLFTQWGAKHAPKIMATTCGEYKRIFGWETDSTSDEYAIFLKSYLKALKIFLKDMDLEKNIMFHISDEPPIKCISFYENALKVVGEEIKDYSCGDALSHFDYYKKGYTKRPIVAVNSPEIDEFVANCDDYWVYYTNGELTENVSNRTISVPSARNRVIGLQMYVGGAKGFLHWGYNYYYGVLSHGIFNPMTNPCGYKQIAGASYIVYPEITGEPIPSLRMKVFYEAINDYGALQLLESLIGKEAVLKFIETTVGKVNYKYCPTGKELFEFRQKLNEEIKKYELSVIILVKPSEKEEIDTFITINKTSKKVDTSLAFVLRNKLNYLENSDNLNISKFEYLAVEVAWKLNYNEFGLWKDRIVFEGPKLIEHYISLNAFVKSFRVLLRYMEKYKIINVNWISEAEIKELIKMLEEITEQIWEKIYNKWIILFDDAKNNKILQGAIGFSSINRLIVIYLKEINKELTLNEFKELISNIIQSIEIDYRKWLPGNTYSKYSSESGYNFVAIDLKDHSYKFY